MHMTSLWSDGICHGKGGSCGEELNKEQSNLYQLTCVLHKENQSCRVSQPLHVSTQSLCDYAIEGTTRSLERLILQWVVVASHRIILTCYNQERGPDSVSCAALILSISTEVN